jgi:ligand-binding sensor domain-containing protein
MGIKKYDHASDRFIPFNPEGLTRYFLTTTIFEDSRGNMWFGTFNGGLYRQDGETGEMGFFDTRNGLWGNFVSYILEDYRGNIWVASMEDWESRGGITVFPPKGTVVFNSTNGLPAQHILCMIEDKEKNILIADRDAGLFIYKGDHFTSFMAPQFLPSNDVFTLAQDHTGRYWFGTGKGLSLYNPRPERGGPYQAQRISACARGDTDKHHQA